MNYEPASEPPLVCLEIPADHRFLHVVSACLAALMEGVEDIAERDAFIYNVQLAVQEACTNIIEHAYCQRAEARLEVRISMPARPRRLTVDLYDCGRPFDATHVVEPNLDEPQIRGYGLFLMRQLTDAVQYERVENRNHWQLSKAY
jgi:serine/threonine-protein kinase RsbW